MRTKLLAYVISGTCAGLAGVVFSAYQGAGYPLNGIGTELDTIAAVVIGGTLLTGGSGFVLGSMIGVFVYGMIKTAISYPRCRAVVDAHHDRRPAADLRGRAAGDRRQIQSRR